MAQIRRGLVSYLKIFVSHSRHDYILKIVENELRTKGHKAYLAEKHISGERMEEKLATNISNSNFVLLLWTKNVVKRPETRDIVIWEIVLGRRFSKPIIALVDEKLKASPVIKQVTTYHSVDFAKQNNVKSVVKLFISQNLRSDDEVYKEFYELVNKYRNVEKATQEIMHRYGYTQQTLAELILKREER